MFRATRRFIQDRQPYTDFVVGTMSMAAYDPARRSYDIVDAIAREVKTSELWTACAGWRVYPYDAKNDRTRFEPWWFIIKPTDTGYQAWDIQPTDQECEFVMDQALAVYSRHELEHHLPGVRPCDLILHQDSWHLDNAGHLQPIDTLDRAGLFAVPRPAATVSFTIIASSNPRVEISLPSRAE